MPIVCEALAIRRGLLSLRKLLVMLALVTVHVQRCEGQQLRRAVSVIDENDYFDFWRPPDQRSDDNYTQGARIRADVAGTPPVFRRRFCPKSIACGSSFEIGQEMYTPMEDAARPIPGQRPYVGWLYVQGTASAASTDARRTLTATVGVTGPPSLAQQTQDSFHSLVPGFRHPLGWDQQLPTELAFAFKAEAERYLSASVQTGRWIDITPDAHATLGTLRTALGAGGRARIGYGLARP